MKKNRTLSLIFVLFFSCGLFAQLTTSTAMTPTQLVNNVLLGGGITATNVTFTGYANAIGSFSVTGTNNLGMSNGVVMTTGTVLANDPTYGAGMGPQGPNNSSGSGADNLQPGDPYLTTVAGANTFNAAILEFDFVPQSDTIKFNYVFGTEEYMEWITGGFADVFAFVVSGVTVTHPATNVALIPGTSTPVTALNVNLNVNPTYYVDNGNGMGSGTAPDGPTVQYDGFTVVLTAIDTVTCGQTYHIKMMVADALDGAVDAGVFLQAGSFSASAPVSISSDVQFSAVDTVLYEGCGTADLIFIRPQSSATSTDTFLVSIGGTASNGTDYNYIDSVIIFAAGQDSLIIPVNAIADGNSEGNEPITLQITTVNACGFPTVVSYVFYVADALPLVLNTSDTVLCLGQSTPITANASGGVGGYNYAWSGGLAPVATNTVNPVTTTNYVVTITDNCGSPPQQDTITVTVLNSLPSLTSINDIDACIGDDINLPTTISGGYAPYNVVWFELPSSIDSVHVLSSSLSLIPSVQAGGTFIVNIIDNCFKTDKDTVVVSVVDCEVHIPNIITANNDGVNDVLFFKNLDQHPNSSLAVFNRWGIKVFESANYNNGWKPDVNDGVYYFILTLPGGKVFSNYFHVVGNK